MPDWFLSVAEGSADRLHEPKTLLTSLPIINTGQRRANKLIRCFLWVVWELVHGWDGQFELTGSMVGGGSEVDEVFKSPSHSFC
jgi:hypothetical protein